jgi:hypothetical protein
VGGRQSVAPGSNARSCAHVKNHIKALPLFVFCSRDATMVRMTYGENCELIAASAYSPYDKDKPMK